MLFHSAITLTVYSYKLSVITVCLTAIFELNGAKESFENNLCYK